MNLLIRTAFQQLAGTRLTILIFHRVLSSPDSLFPDEPDASRFDEIMSWIKSWFNVLPLEVAAQALKTGTLPQRAAAITFDDGYADNHDVALPILRKHGLPCTFFIATGFLDGGRMWNDTIIESVRNSPMPVLDLRLLNLGCYNIETIAQKQSAIKQIISQIKYSSLAEREEKADQISEIAVVHLPSDLMMTSKQVVALHDAGMQIGAHTVSHPILARTDITTVRKEISASKEKLEALLGNPILTFAYPNGKPGQDYFREHTGVVRDLGFSAAVSTSWGAASTSSDLLQLPRFTPWSRRRANAALQFARNFYTTEDRV